MNKNLTTLLAAALLATTSAFAELIDFDDLGSTSIPNGYHGLDWNNLHMTPTNYGGYLNGRISGTNSTFNGSGNSATIINSSVAFDFNSGYFTAAWNNGLQLDIVGLNGSTVLYSNTFTLNSNSPLFLTLDYLGVTQIYFNSYGGTDAGWGGSGTHFTMDNLTINGSTSVPDSGSTVACLAAGLTAMLAFRRRQV